MCCLPLIMQRIKARTIKHLAIYHKPLKKRYTRLDIPASTYLRPIIYNHTTTSDRKRKWRRKAIVFIFAIFVRLDCPTPFVIGVWKWVKIERSPDQMAGLVEMSRI